MTSTSQQAFKEFTAKLILTPEQKQLVADRHRAVAGYLSTAFSGNSAVPLASTELIGSAARDTIIRPLDDIDMKAEFRDKDSVFEKYRYDSRAFLYLVRNALNEHSTVKIVGARGQAVRFFYANGPHVDVAPMFKWSGDGWALPDGSGGWLTTDPAGHTRYVDARHAALGYQLKPVVRILKRWNNVHSKHLKSFHLEIMIESSFSTLGNDLGDAVEKWFTWAPSKIDVHDPAGHGGVLSGYLTHYQRQALVSNLESARSRALLANAASRRGDHEESLRQWGFVFGGEFPTYG